MIAYSEVDLWVDPEAMLAQLIDATIGCDLLEARRMARRLAGWILHGGRAPAGFPPALVLKKCGEAEAWAGRMLAGDGR